MNIHLEREAIIAACNDDKLRRCRAELAQFASETFSAAGQELHVVGHIVGSDRVDGTSPFGHGNDETVAVSVLLRIAAQLVSASADLFADRRHYAAALTGRHPTSFLVNWPNWAASSVLFVVVSGTPELRASETVR